MAIQPISGTDYLSRNAVSFGRRRNKGGSDNNHATSSVTKAVPFVVLLSMSPLTQCATAENYNKIASSPTTELVVQNPQNPEESKLPNMIVGARNKEYLRVWGVSRDDNPDDAETFLFNYVKALGDGKVAVLAGQFLAISDTPREDGRYLMMYSPYDDSGHISGKYELVALPEKFIVPPNYAAKSPANNKACGIETMATFEEWFGEKAVKDAPNIEDCANRILNKKN